MEWYRGVIAKVYENDEVTVHFIDYGNNQKCEKSDVTEMLPEFLTMGSFAYNCYLDGFRAAKTLTDDKCSLFNSVVPKRDFHVVFPPIENNKFPVKYELF